MRTEWQNLEVQWQQWISSLSKRAMNHLPSSQNRWGVSSVPHRKQICKRRCWRGAAPFLPQGSCAVLHPVSRESHGTDASFFSHVCQQPQHLSGRRLSKVWFYIPWLPWKFCWRNLIKVFHNVFLRAGENEIPTLHLSLGQTSLPAR